MRADLLIYIYTEINEDKGNRRGAIKRQLVNQMEDKRLHIAVKTEKAESSEGS